MIQCANSTFLGKYKMNQKSKQLSLFSYKPVVTTTKWIINTIFLNEITQMWCFSSNNSTNNLNNLTISAVADIAHCSLILTLRHNIQTKISVIKILKNGYVGDYSR